MAALQPWTIPMAVLTDSYKATHFMMYPEALKMVAYGEFRTPFRGSQGEGRFVFYGIRYLVETYLHRQWTLPDLDLAEKFFSAHNAGHTTYPWPRDLFERFIKENRGYFPVKVEALPEGTCAHIHVPVYQITAEGDYSRLVTFLETVLTHIWYPCTVATLSRRTREVVEEAFEKSVDPKDFWALDSRLHDFGFRGCTSVEQSVLGGCAHLLSFAGTDTMSAAYYAQFHLNGGRPVASSIPATEHSVMTSWPSEKAAILNMIEKFGSGAYSIVMDSYDYFAALEKVIPAVAAQKVAKGGYMVLRPDSGDPTEMVLAGLRAVDKVFGSDGNAKGFRVIRGAGVIQGDGVSIDMIKNVYDEVLRAGYAAQNAVFGMGGGLLQKVDRDTMSFATKLSYIHYKDGTRHDIMKKPRSDSGKISLPGVLQVRRVNGIPTVFPADADGPRDPDNLLRVVYDKGPVPGLQWDDFDTVRSRVHNEWKALPRQHDPLSPAMKEKIQRWIAGHVINYDA